MYSLKPQYYKFFKIIIFDLKLKHVCKNIKVFFHTCFNKFVISNILLEIINDSDITFR
jgi:hypothetical protein